MRRLLSIPFLLCLLPSFVNAQTYHHINQASGTQMFPGNSVTIGNINGAPCPGSPAGITTSPCGLTGYAIGCATANGFSYSFTNPLSDIRIKLVGLVQGEQLNIKIDNVQYNLSPSELSPHPGSCNLPLSYTIQNGSLGSTTQTPGEGAQIDINTGNSMSSIEITNTMASGGQTIVYQLYVVNDTCNPYTPQASTTNPCEGANLTLSSTTVTGATYTWYKIGNPNPVSTQQNFTIPNATLADAGMYTVIATYGACNRSSSVTANVIPRPVASGTTSDAPKCPGSTINLSTDNVPGATYSWTGPNFSSTQEDPSIPNIQANQQGDYIVTLMKNGCISIPDTTTVTLNTAVPTPDLITSDTVCPGTSLSILVQNHTSQVTEYHWTGPGYSNTTNTPYIPAISNVSYGNAGKYYVVAEDINGCQSFPDSIDVVVKILTPTPNATDTVIVCPGTTLQLNSSTVAGATYVWTGPSFTSPLQNPAIPNANYGQAGKYYVTAKVNGCVSAPDSTIVNVEITTPTPDAENEIIVCPKTKLDLKASDVTGATYEWTGPSFTSSQQNPSIDPATAQNAGYYYVKATVNGCISHADSTLVKVEITTPTPDASSNGPVCRGHELRLGVGSIPGATYSWTGPSGFSSNAQYPVVTSADTKDSGIYIITADVDGCVSLPDTIYVGLKPMPDILSVHSNQPAICEGDSLILTAKGLFHTDEVKYMWTGPNGFESAPSHVVGIGNVSNKAAGKYFVHAEMDGCISEPKSVEVAVKVRPDRPTISSNSPAPDMPKNVGDEVELYGDSGLPNTTYNWTGPQGFTSQDQNPVIPYATKLTEGWYYLTITFGGCTSRDSTYVMIVPQTYYTLFPNPNNGNFTLKAGLIYDQEVPIEITNIMGQVVYKDKAEVKGKLLLKTFSLGGNLSNGIYFLRLASKEEKWDIRFVISR